MLAKKYLRGDCMFLKAEFSLHNQECQSCEDLQTTETKQNIIQFCNTKQQ